jgi:phosphonoacetaldehyde hydrolase
MGKYGNGKEQVRGVQAVILDWAGTAVDYGCLAPTSGFIEAFRRQGVEVSVEEARVHAGLKKREHVHALCRMESVMSNWREVHGKNPRNRDEEALYRDLEPILIAAAARYAEPVPGAADFVGRMMSQGIRVGSTTGYPRRVMDVLVPEARKRGYETESTVCSDDVKIGRPYPWMCYVSAMELDVYPMHALVKIGDTAVDMQEGLNAGMWTVGVVMSGNEMGLSREQAKRLDRDDLDRRLQKARNKLAAAGAHYVADGIWECSEIIEDIGARLARGEHPS